MSEIYQTYQPIESRCACAIPEGAELTVIWDKSENVEIREHPAGNTAIYAWAKPGNHYIEMIAVYQYGRWQEVVTDIVDGQPVKENIRVSTGVDVKRFVKPFVVLDTNPKPDPKPDPKPNPNPKPNPFPDAKATYMVVIRESAQNRQVTSIIDQLRQKSPGSVSEFHVFDPDQKGQGTVADTWIKLADGKPLPHLILADKDGYIVFEGELKSYSQVLDLVTK